MSGRTVIHYEVPSATGRLPRAGYAVSEHFTAWKDRGRGRWMLDHLPSGLSIGGEFRTLREATNVAINLECLPVRWDFRTYAQAMRRLSMRTQRRIRELTGAGPIVRVG